MQKTFLAIGLAFHQNPIKGSQIPNTDTYLEQIGRIWHIRFLALVETKLYVIDCFAPATQIRVILLPSPDPLLGRDIRRRSSYGETCCREAREARWQSEEARQEGAATTTFKELESQDFEGPHSRDHYSPWCAPWCQQGTPQRQVCFQTKSNGLPNRLNILKMKDLIFSCVKFQWGFNTGTTYTWLSFIP